jgi:hypothetical protein
MKPDDLIAALDLPAAARVDRRVPKTLLTEHGAPTAADKRRITEGIEQVQWVAALKPTTVGVAEYRDEAREYLEISVLHLVLRASAKLGRLVELLHRAVPYPVVALAEQGEHTQLSLAHKRWSQGEAGKTVLDGDLVAVDPTEVDEPIRAAFLSALALGRQPRGTLFALYQGWIDTLLALHAARRTNAFAILETADARAARREALGECERLEAEIARLRAAAAKEKQMARQVELNLELKRLEAERASAKARL